MKFSRDFQTNSISSISKWIFGGLILTALSACGSSTPDVGFRDNTPRDFYEGARILKDTQLVDLVAGNPLFDITDARGVHYGTVALNAGERANEALPVCPTAIPGPLARCIPRGARIVNGRLSVGVAEFGGETGLYYIDQQAICFSSLSALGGCHQLAVRFDRTIEVKTSDGLENFWIRRGV